MTENLSPAYNIYPLQGSNATGDCCSKCWASVASATKKEEGGGSSSSDNTKADSDGKANAAKSEPETVESKDVVAEQPADESKDNSKTGETDNTTIVAAKDDNTLTLASNTLPPKKKKKKKGYKGLMAGMLEGTDRDIDKEKEKQIKKVTGGGAFQKIDKI